MPKQNEVHCKHTVPVEIVSADIGGRWFRRDKPYLRTVTLRIDNDTTVTLAPVDTLDLNIKFDVTKT